MIITCTECGTKYNIADSRISKDYIKARCARCKSVFQVNVAEMRRKNAVAAAESTPAPRPLSKPRDFTYNFNCKVVAVCNQKGGVAKTTTTMNLASALAGQGKRVLVIDFDIQANLSMLLGYPDHPSFFELMSSGEGKMGSFIVQTKPGFALLPSSSKMSLLSKNFMNQENFEYLLRERLAEIHNDYDYVLIDTPPSGDFYTLNALLASKSAIIPTQCEYLSMNGVAHIENMIKVIQERTQHAIDYRIMISMFESGNTAAKVVLQQIRNKYAGRVLNTMIEKDSKIQEAQIVHSSVLQYAPGSPSAQRYQQLAQEIMAL